MLYAPIPIAAATVEKSGISCQVPWTWLGRLWIEFLHPDTLVEMLEAIFREGPSGPKLLFSNMTGERTLWD